MIEWDRKNDNFVLLVGFNKNNGYFPLILIFWIVIFSKIIEIGVSYSFG